MIDNKNTEQQWLDDVEVYGDYAYLWWRCYGVRDYPLRMYSEFKSNVDAADIIFYGDDDVAFRIKDRSAT